MDYEKLAKHCIGLDRKKPYIRHGKKFYKPYRNFYATGKDQAGWDELVLAGYEDADEKIREMYEDHFGLIDLAEEYIKSVAALNGGKEPRNIIYLSDEDADKWKSGLIAACHCKDCTHKEWRGSSGRVYCPKTHSWRDADDFCKFAEKGDECHE